MCLAQGHNAVTPVRLEPGVSKSCVKHSTTESLCSHIEFLKSNLCAKQVSKQYGAIYRCNAYQILLRSQEQNEIALLQQASKYL